MADTLTISIDEETAAELRRRAEETGETIEQTAARLLAEVAADPDSNFEYQLSEEQLADLDKRLLDPGPLATPEEVEAVMSKFRARG